MIFVESRRKSEKTLNKSYPKAEVIDLTSKGAEPFVRFSPFYPHGDIPVPFFQGEFSYSVEGIWQGLKVFDDFDIDTSKFMITNMKEIKRTVRKFGRPLGHRKGPNGDLLDYLAARKEIYLVSYYWILENKLKDLLDLLIDKARTNDLVFLDYETNEDIGNTKKPISHAALVKRYLEERYPKLLSKRFTQPLASNAKEKARKKKSPNQDSSAQLKIGFE